MTVDTGARKAEDENAGNGGAGRRGLFGTRLLSLCGWTFIVCSGLYELVTHHGRIAGFHGFSTWLGIVVGTMCVFNEIKGLLEDPQ